MIRDFDIHLQFIRLKNIRFNILFKKVNLIYFFSDKEIMKKSKFTLFLIIFLGVLLLLVAGAFTAIGIASYKPTIAFYNVSEKVQNAIIEQLKTMPLGKKGKAVSYNVITLDNSVSLSSQNKSLKKVQMLFATMDMDVEDFARSRAAVPQKTSLLNGMPSSTKTTAISDDENLYAVPLLYDFYQIDVNRQDFYDSNIKSIDVWSDLTSFFADTISKKTINDSREGPFCFNGGEADQFLDILGCLIEATDGADELKKIEQDFYSVSKLEGNDLTDALLTICKKYQNLEAISILRELYNNSYVSKSVFTYKNQDAIFFVNNEMSNSIALKLSEHRSISNKVINDFSSIYFPATKPTAIRSFCAPTVCGIGLKKKKSVETAMNLLSSSRQSELCMKTGLAPVQSSCSVPDKQADDVRFWLAASNGPIMPLSGAFPSDEASKLTADTFISFIRF